MTSKATFVISINCFCLWIILIWKILKSKRLMKSSTFFLIILLLLYSASHLMWNSWHFCFRQPFVKWSSIVLSLNHQKTCHLDIIHIFLWARLHMCSIPSWFSCMNASEDFILQWQKKVKTWARCFLLYLWVFYYILTVTENCRCWREKSLFIHEPVFM